MASDNEVLGAGNAGARVISIEAEYHDDRSESATHQWVHEVRSGASNDDAMVTTPDVGTLQRNTSTSGSPKLSYLVSFDEPGDYYLWIRGWGDSDSTGEGGNDSVHAGINGRISGTADKIDNFPAGWHWSRHTRDNAVAVIKVPSRGVHAINLWMREDGLAIDKFLLTMDESYAPSGVPC